jgi:hypothetical protein
MDAKKQNGKPGSRESATEQIKEDAGDTGLSQ